MTIPYNSAIETPSDVREFFGMLIDYNINFHPDDSFADLIYIGIADDEGNHIHLFSEKEAGRLDALMNRCFDVCDKYYMDICLIALDLVNAKYLSNKTTKSNRIG